MLKAILFASLFPIAYHIILVLIRRRIKQNTELMSTTKLDSILWPIFSKYVRAKEADWKGFVTCFTCPVQDEWKYFDAGHCLPKGATGSVLKYDERNVKPQCKMCNQGKGGNRKEFERRLKAIYGENIITELRRLTEAALTTADYQQKIPYYTNQLKLINSR